MDLWLGFRGEGFRSVRAPEHTVKGSGFGVVEVKSLRF